ncbi:MAG: FAD-dependent oxidoreductase [Pirellulaceae bacterium]
MKVAISGCGITGAAVACLLAEMGHDIQVFEQAEQCRPVGAGIMLQPSGQQVLADMGLLDGLAEVSARLDGLLALHKSGRQLVSLKYQWLNRELFGLGVHRGTLFTSLLNRALHLGVQIHSGHRIVDYTVDDDSVSVVSEHGACHGGFDFLIAADGSRSQLRSTAGIRSKIVEYDFAALWATGNCDYLPGSLVQIVNGTRQLVGILPIGKGQASFFWGLPAAEWEQLQESPIVEWKQAVLDVCPDAVSMLDEMEDFGCLTFARYRHVKMSSWYADRIVFLGDAAHATSPHLGQGVNLGLEDARCFVDALQSTGDFQGACRLFSKQRRRKLRYYSQLTHMLTPFFQSHGRVRGTLRNIFLPWFPRTPFVRREMIRTLSGYKNGWLR